MIAFKLQCDLVIGWKLFTEKIHPSFLFQSTQEYVNPAFEFDEATENDPKFADFVDQLLQQATYDDVHPYGRGNLYDAVFNENKPSFRGDSSKLIVWMVITIILVALTGGIILLAGEFQCKRSVYDMFR